MTDQVDGNATMNLRRGLQIGTVAAAVATLACLTQEPFIEPYVARSVAESELALEKALKRRLTPDWVAAELDAAVGGKDLARTELLLEVVEEEGIPVPDAQIAEARRYVEQEKGFLATLGRCTACMADPAKCGTPSVFLLCNASIEFTPIGDARILVEAGANAATGNTVDRIDVALATVGLGATALVPLTGGTSYSLKIGSTTIRVARKLGGLGGTFERALEKAADVRWEKLGDFVRTRNLDLLTDSRGVRELAELSEHVGTVAHNAGRLDAVLLLKHVEKGADAVGLARVSSVAGTETRKAVELLGLPRAVRAVSRMSDLFLATIGLIVALVGQIIALASPIAVRALRALLVRVF